MRKLNRQLNIALKGIGFSSRVTGHTVRIKKTMTVLKLMGFLVTLLSLIVFGYCILRLYNNQSLNYDLPIAGAVLFIGGLLILLGIHGEYYIINRQLKTIRDVRSKDQRPMRFDFPPVLLIKDYEKKDRYKESRLCFSKGDDWIETITFNKAKFAPGRLKTLTDALENWLTLNRQGALPPPKNN